MLRPRGAFQVFVKTGSGRTITLTLQPLDSIANVWSQLQHKLQHIGLRQHGLVYGGNLLDHRRTLSDYNVHQRSTLHLVPCLRGGMLRNETAEEPLATDGPMASDKDVYLSVPKSYTTAFL